VVVAAGVELVVLIVNVMGCATPSPAITRHCDVPNVAPVGSPLILVMETARAVEPFEFVTLAVNVAVPPGVIVLGVCDPETTATAVSEAPTFATTSAAITSTAATAASASATTLFELPRLWCVLLRREARNDMLSLP
jgi:hypothetical protein